MQRRNEQYEEMSRSCLHKPSPYVSTVCVPLTLCRGEISWYEGLVNGGLLTEISKVPLCVDEACQDWCLFFLETQDL